MAEITLKPSPAWACATDALRHAVEENANSSQNVTAAGGILAEIARQMRELLPSVPELDEYCPMIGIAVPSPLRNASEDVLLSVAGQFRTASARLRARKESWGQISSAVSAYQSRLSEEKIDLSKATIAEANVAGATCSGIAGSRDFADDFDW